MTSGKIVNKYQDIPLGGVAPLGPLILQSIIVLSAEVYDKVMLSYINTHNHYQ